MSRVIVVGSINVDLVVSAPRLPAPGETVLGGRFARHFGGKGANQAVAAARAGASVRMIGAVGDDADGVDSRAALAAEGIDTALVQALSSPTGVALIAVAPDGENLIVVASGANGDLALGDEGIGSIGPGDLLLASLEIPMGVVLESVSLAVASGAMLVINAAPAQALPDELLARRPILTTNEHELLVSGGAATPDEAIAALQSRGAGLIVVTLGAAGAEIVDGAARRRIAARDTPAVDATGAGDTFVGVMAAWLAGGATLHEAAAAGNAAAGLKVGVAGAREGMPERAAIEAELLR